MKSDKNAMKNRFTTRHSGESILLQERYDSTSARASRKLARMIVLSDPRLDEKERKGKTLKQIKKEWRKLLRKEREKKAVAFGQVDRDIVSHIVR